MPSGVFLYLVVLQSIFVTGRKLPVAGNMVVVEGIEPSSLGYQPSALPLSYTTMVVAQESNLNRAVISRLLYH